MIQFLRFSSRSVINTASMACKELSKASSEEVQAFFKSFDTVLLDCDGVLWRGPNSIPGCPEMVHKFRAMGKKVIYVTNNATKSRKEYVTKCEDLGFGGKFDEIFTTSYLVPAYLKSIGYKKKIYLIGSPGITQELDDAGFQHFGAGKDPMPDVWDGNVAQEIAENLDPNVEVVVCSYDLHISYLKIMKAISYLARPGVQYVATNLDERFPYSGKCVVPGTGSLVASVTTASRREPFVLGKPSKFIFEAVQKVHPDVKPERTLMVGDNVKTDILLGKNCGLRTLMVGTGVDSLERVRQAEASSDEAERRYVPDFFANSLADLLPLANAASASSSTTAATS